MSGHTPTGFAMSSVGVALKSDAVEQVKLPSTGIAATRGRAQERPALSADQASISQTGRLRGSTLVVQDAIDALSQAQVWQAQQVTSSQPQIAEASTQDPGERTHAVTVEQTATGQVVVSNGFSSLATVVGIGTLGIEMGRWDSASSTFATNPNWPKANISLDGRDNTMEKVRDRINAAGVGVIATVMTDATGSRLVLSSASTGADNGFRISAEGAATAAVDQSNGLAQLGFNPGQIGSGMQLVQAAQDAQVRIDDQVATSETNFVTDPASGLQLKLQPGQTGSTTLTVRPDDQVVNRQIQAWQASVNDLRDQLANTPADPQASPQDARQSARQDGQQVLDEMRRQMTGDQASAWADIGLSWDDQAGVVRQDVTWQDALRQQGQQLFAQLKQSLNTAPSAQDSAQPQASAVTPRQASSLSPAAAELNRQRLMDQYAAAPAANDVPRQDFAVS